MSNFILIKQLHTAIRRYCIENYQFWWNKYLELADLNNIRDDSDYTDEAYSIFPRYNLLNAILTEVEKTQPSDFSNFAEAKEYFCLVANQAENVFTKPPNNEIANRVMDEERQKLSEFIVQLKATDLAKVEPLFYRRVLSENENQALREKLKFVWKVDGYWFPLTGWKPQDTEAFQDKYFEEELGYEKIQQILRNLGVQRIWELREGEVNYEIDVNAAEFYYYGEETFWFDNTFAWLIYVSHESSITFAGSILPEIKKNWTNWQERLWDSPFFD
jgi:hypothetical protein